MGIQALRPMVLKGILPHITQRQKRYPELITSIEHKCSSSLDKSAAVWLIHQPQCWGLTWYYRYYKWLPVKQCLCNEPTLGQEGNQRPSVLVASSQDREGSRQDCFYTFRSELSNSLGPAVSANYESTKWASGENRTDLWEKSTVRPCRKGYQQ